MDDDEEIERALRECGLWSPAPRDEDEDIPSLDDIAAEEEGPRRNYGWQDEWGDWHDD